MTLDHINTYALNGRYPALFEAGRLVMPIFSFVLAYNLARPAKAGVHKRIITRLLIAGGVAMPFFTALHAFSLFPLNIMFTLALSTACIYLLECQEKTYLIFGVLFVFGTLVEYFYPAVLFTIFAWQYCHTGQKQHILWMLLTIYPIGLLNGSMTGSFALLVIYTASKIKLNFEIPRCKTFFYSYYPAHLSLIYLFKTIN